MHFKDFRTIESRRLVHESYGNKWYPWVLKAQELNASAEILRAEYTTRNYLPNDLDKYEDTMGSSGSKVFNVILMLWAMAAECFLKALWLKHGEKLMIGGRYKKIPDTNDHQLDTLAEALSRRGIFDFTETEIDVLYRLSPFITSGRYPISKEFVIRNRNAPKEMESGGWSLPQDDILLGNLFMRISKKFQS
jgi:hypothetical protein